MSEFLQSGLSKALFTARYSILKLLGSGAYGKVFLARQNALSRLVAVKFFAPRRDDSLQEDTARFLRETQLLGRLSHPRIVPVFDANLLGRTRFLVTEYLDGGDLSRHLTPGQPLDQAEAVRLGLAVAEGLEYLHAESVVHRDLKPENILLGTDGAVKLTDFGLARSLQPGQDLTAKGAMLGTPAYLAPETIRTGESTAASDVYALGVLLFECFDGRYPYDPFESVAELMTRKVEQEALAPGPHVPAPLAALVSASLSRDPARRPTARKLKLALSAMNRPSGGASVTVLQAAPGRSRGATERLGVPTVLARSTPPSGDRWRAGRPLLAVGGVVLLAAVAALAWRGGLWRPAPVSGPALAPAPPLQAPATVAPPAAPSLRAPRPKLDEELLQRFCDAVHPAEFQWKLRAGMSADGMRQRLEKKGILAIVRQMLAAGGPLPMEGMRMDVMTKAVESLLTLRLAVGRFWAMGLELPADYEQLAERSFPLLRGPPAGAARVLEVGSGFPVEIPLELSVMLGDPGFQWPLRIPPSVLAGWKRQPPRRLWWVLQVRSMNLRSVVDLRIETVHGTARLPLLAVRGPVQDEDARYSGTLSLGFDWRLVEAVAGPVQITYSLLGGKLSIGPPSLEKLELWEEPAR